MKLRPRFTASLVISSRMRRSALSSQVGLLALAEAVQVVGLLEGGERMKLKALAGEVLEQDLAAAEAHLVAGSGVGHTRPVLAVALELEERHGHASCAEAAPQGQRLDRGEHVAQLGRAGAAEAAERAHVTGRRSHASGGRRAC